MTRHFTRHFTRWALACLALLPGVTAAVAACGPHIRPAPFVGARDRITGASLIGPFDGQVLDANTSEPVRGATVVGIWSYDQGDGLTGPAGSETVEVKTDVAGRYRIPPAPMRIRGPQVRLVSFELVVYKRGYAGYRSDVSLDGRPRTDFVVRHNRVQLQKWRDADSHAEHLLFLSGPPEITQIAKWERASANLDLLRAQTGAVADPALTPDDAAVEVQVLDASMLLSPAEVRRRTGFTEAFEVRELEDFPRTHFYHGVHLMAADREDQEWDVSYRVWKNPPAGLTAVRETFEATLPGVTPVPEVTEETWIYDSDAARAVAFLDATRDIAVLLTCGTSQCADIETVILLANFLYDRLDLVTLVQADQAQTSEETTP